MACVPIFSLIKKSSAPTRPGVLRDFLKRIARICPGIKILRSTPGEDEILSKRSIVDRARLFCAHPRNSNPGGQKGLTRALKKLHNVFEPQKSAADGACPAVFSCPRSARGSSEGLSKFNLKFQTIMLRLSSTLGLSSTEGTHEQRLWNLGSYGVCRSLLERVLPLVRETDGKESHGAAQDLLFGQMPMGVQQLEAQKA